MINIENEIKELIRKAVKSNDSQDAMRLTQAACNAANTMVALSNIREK